MVNLLACNFLWPDIIFSRTRSCVQLKSVLLTLNTDNADKYSDNHHINFLALAQKCSLKLSKSHNDARMSNKRSHGLMRHRFMITMWH